MQFRIPVYRSIAAFAAAVSVTIAAAAGCSSGKNGERGEAPARTQKADEPARAKYVILMIGDGMQLAHEIAASRYLHGSDRSLSWHSFPVREMCTTFDVTCYDRYAFNTGKSRYDEMISDPEIGYSVALGGEGTYDGVWNPPSDAYFTTHLEKWGGGSKLPPATDSASAGTAIACGKKTDDGNISWTRGDPVNGALRTLFEDSKTALGMATGVVTTVQFSHATPAVFVSHNVSRNNYSSERKDKGYEGLGISEEIIRQTRPDVVIGAGHPVHGPKGYISISDYERLRDGCEPTYGSWLFVERKGGEDGSAAIIEGARAAVASNRNLFGLFGGKEGYFEHPAPADMPGSPSFTTTAENPTLSAASTAALQVLQHRGGASGFLVMIEGGDIDWACHASDYAWMIGAMKQFDDAVRSVVEFVDRPGDGMDWENTLLIVTADHANGYIRFGQGTRLGIGDLPEQVPGKPPVYPDGTVRFGVNNAHTNEPVMLYAKGACSGAFIECRGLIHKGTKLIDNTHIYLVMKKAIGLAKQPAAATEAGAALQSQPPMANHQ